MDFVEVLEGRSHLRHHRPCIGQVHVADVVAPERIDEVLGHPVALRTAHGCIDRRPAQRLAICRVLGAMGVSPLSETSSKA